MTDEAATLLLTGFESRLVADAGTAATYATLDLHLWCAETQKTTTQRVAIQLEGMIALSQALTTLAGDLAQIQAASGHA